MVRGPQVSERVKLLTGVLALQLCLGGFHVMTYDTYNLFPFTVCRITANQGFYLLGLFYLSPTYASAIQNTIPAITFAMAAAVRLERVNINRRYGLAKVVGTVVTIGGATIITLYKGTPLLQHDKPHFVAASILSSSPIMNWTLGCVYLLACCLAWSAWMVPVLQKYPKRLSFLTLTCTFGLIQFMAIAAFAEDDFQRWKIHSRGELFTVLYAGVVASGIALSLQIWCIDRGGPLYTAIFQPVQTVAVAIMSAFILGDQFYSGGIIGSILIVIGLYFVLWGKSEEKKAIDKEMEENLTRHLLSQQDSHLG
ncbi:Auxin-induced protein 5NG4 [Ananas comosus]|uniref:WAT1-related protein n=1 Tax=Ananas comosus TaxID=4615 RepID=A0A199UUJ7_ANACO|nr:Auxin-induced protein 5NG4 [Ananas comosus]